ncbi:flagellar basal body-associated FliL family protein [Marinobacter sp.]|uniref:flagellar basal body-associated FliL family protein n=1 Tax=Marinobacter sp. TaxID=50741 RepID=UPI00384EB355
MIPKANSFFWLFFAMLFTALAGIAHADENKEETAEDEEAAPKTTLYINMEPAFVTHVGPPGEKLTYLKADVTLRASSPEAEDAVEAHMPRLRHEFITMVGNQTDVDFLTSSEGKQALREMALQRINSVLEEQQTGVQIDDVLFTSFVVQR